MFVHIVIHFIVQHNLGFLGFNLNTISFASSTNSVATTEVAVATALRTFAI